LGTIFLLKLIGLSACFLLLAYDIDNSNPFIKNVCGEGKNNCNAVLSSKASKLGRFTWSEIGFFYFTATSIWLLLPTIPASVKIHWLALGNVIALPYIFFSLYYQWKIVRQWCPICLTVQSVLLAEFAWSMINCWITKPNFTGDFDYIVAVLGSLLLPILFWSALKPLFIAAKDGQFYQSAHFRLQHNPDIFNELLMRQPQAPQGWKQLGIAIGNYDAPHTIIKVCNPHCGPCARTHPLLDQLIKNNPNIRVQVIFRTRDTNPEATITKHLLAIAAGDDRPRTHCSLDDWYGAGVIDYPSFAAKYPITGDLDDQIEKISAMRSWCDTAGVTHTPTFFVDGFLLPENYDIETLEHIL
jgi:uncharacterized membrane protein